MMYTEQFFLGIGVCLLLGSVLLFFSGKMRFSLVVLLLATFCLFVFSALLDPFLHLWDERFHALVAKNMMQHPFIPTLYDDPVVPMEYDRWDRVHIWLHKQPLFLWPISLSLSLFGTAEFALRLPSVILGTCTIFFVYQIGSNLVNPATGFFSAFLGAASFYIFDLVGGRIMLDHNDIAFLFYITGSLWAFSAYQVSGNRWWIFCIGLFSGGAILCKWLTGLLVYLVWGSYLVIEANNWKRFTSLLMALSITLVVVLPWQLYIFALFPNEARHEMAYAAKHFTTVIEGHGGDFRYYFSSFPQMFGNLAPWLLIPGLILLFRWMKNNALFFSWFMITPLFIYMFFSLAKTKMPSFPLIVAPIIWIILGVCMAFIWQLIHRLLGTRTWVIMLTGLLSMAVASWFIMDIPDLYLRSAKKPSPQSYEAMMIHNREIFQSLPGRLPESTVLFNVKGRHYIEAMYYSGFTSYNFIPSRDQVEVLKSRNRPMALFSGNIEMLPNYLSMDSTIMLLPDTIRGYE